jgi:hypothetical protein
MGRLALLAGSAVEPGSRSDMRGQMLTGDLDPGGQNRVFGAA